MLQPKRLNTLASIVAQAPFIPPGIFDQFLDAIGATHHPEDANGDCIVCKAFSKALAENPKIVAAMTNATVHTCTQTQDRQEAAEEMATHLKLALHLGYLAGQASVSFTTLTPNAQVN